MLGRSRLAADPPGRGELVVQNALSHPPSRFRHSRPYRDLGQIETRLAIVGLGP